MKDFENVAPPPRVGLSLCAGGGGLDLGTELACPGFTTAVCVEWEEYPRAVLQAGQEAGYMRPAPIWGDLTEFSGRPWRGVVDTVLAGYPCQPFSAAGQRKGENDERHLWPHVARIIDECRPRWVILENVAGHISLGLETVLRELWGLGFTPATGLFSAGETGAAHERQRVFIVAYCDGEVSGGLRVGAPQEPTISGKRRINELAHSDGRDARAEREQRGGEQRFQPESGGTGGGDVEDAANRDGGIHPRSGRPGQAAPDTGRASGEGILGDTGHTERGQSVAAGHHANRPDTGRAQADGGFGEPSENLVNPPRNGRREGRSEPEFRRGRDTAGIANGELADASGAGSQGRERGGSPGQRDRAPASGSTAELRRAFVHAPGPSDADAWSHVLATAPYLAPAAGLGDCLAWARDVAALVEGPAQQEAESALCGMAHGLASRSRALRLLGNGVCPLAAGYAVRSLLAAHGVSGMDMATAGGD